MLGAIPAMTDVTTSWANYEEAPPLPQSGGDIVKSSSGGTDISDPTAGSGMTTGENVGVQTGGKTDVGSGTGTGTGTNNGAGAGGDGDDAKTNYLPYILLGGLALFFLFKRK